MGRISLYEGVGRRVLFHRFPDAEEAHEAAMRSLERAAFVPGVLRAVAVTCRAPDPRLAQRVMGLDFAAPLGLAAGFDKDARVVEGLQALGFGHVEIGTVVPEPQQGNPRPRLFRVPEARAIINRMGFNSSGMLAVRANLERMRERGRVRIPVGASIGKQASTDVNDLDAVVRDHVRVVRELRGLVDYFTFNPSSPNTAGLRSLQTYDNIIKVATPIKEAAGTTPVLIKLAPDLSEEDAQHAIEGALWVGLQGAVLSNTAVRADLYSELAALPHAQEKGGRSGPFLKRLLVPRIKQVRALAATRPFVIVAVGGIGSGEDVCDALAAGADLCQAYTQFVYRGPRFAAHVHREVSHMLDHCHAESIEDFREVVDLYSRFSRSA